VAFSFASKLYPLCCSFIFAANFFEPEIGAHRILGENLGIVCSFYETWFQAKVVESSQIEIISQTKSPYL
jgi:hypothetical protein